MQEWTGLFSSRRQVDMRVEEMLRINVCSHQKRSEYSPRFFTPILCQPWDNHHCESLLVVEISETSENPTLSIMGSAFHCDIIYYIILNYIILYYIDIIQLRESANGHDYFLLHFVVQSWLQGGNADRLSRQSMNWNSQEGSNIELARTPREPRHSYISQAENVPLSNSFLHLKFLHVCLSKVDQHPSIPSEPISHPGLGLNTNAYHSQRVPTLPSLSPCPTLLPPGRVGNLRWRRGDGRGGRPRDRPRPPASSWPPWTGAACRTPCAPGRPHRTTGSTAGGQGQRGGWKEGRKEIGKEERKEE